MKLGSSHSTDKKVVKNIKHKLTKCLAHIRSHARNRIAINKRELFTMQISNRWDPLDVLSDDTCGITLIPLSKTHINPLWEIGSNQSIWKHTFKKPYNFAEFEKIIEEALEFNVNKIEKTYTICLNNSTPIGSTRIKKISQQHLRAEIGDTWLGIPWQRTFVNTQAKFLLLQHAFEEMKCIRVEFKTDVLNIQSRNAILRIGAKEEGVFRQHMIMPCGKYRDSVYFSIISSEWSKIKYNLIQKIKLYK